MITELIHEARGDLADTLAQVGVHTLTDLAKLDNGRSQLCWTIGLNTEELNLLQSLLERVGQPLKMWLDDWTEEQERNTIEHWHNTQPVGAS